MKAIKLPVLFVMFLLVFVSSSIAAATDSISKINRLPPSLEQKVQDLRASLEANGYEVARGYWTLWSVEDCKYAIRAVGNCYGNNPTAPYVMAFLPHWNDEFVDQSLHHALSQARRNMTANYRLGEREALVVMAELPPPARYFGIQTNVFTREETINQNDPIYNIVTDPLLKSILFGSSPNPSRMMMVASIGDSINHIVIDRQSGAVWGQQRFIVIASDADIVEAMTDALVQTGANEEDVFAERVSPDLVRLGYEAAADDLITYIRYSLPDDKTLGEQWREQLPLTVLRVRDTDRSSILSPFPIPAYENKEGNVNYNEVENLTDDLGVLVASVKAYWNQSDDAQGKPFFSAYRALDLVGQHCLGWGSPYPNRGPMNCLGDSQDADYQISPSLHIDGNNPSLRLDDGPVIALVGSLGTETGNATYVSLSINRFPLLVGVQNIDDDKLKGSAAKFLDQVNEDLDFASKVMLSHDPDLFYVYFLARDCSGLDPCLEIPRQMVPWGETIKVIQRNYVNPGSTVGPDPGKVLNPVIIELDGQNRPMEQ